MLFYRLSCLIIILLVMTGSSLVNAQAPEATDSVETPERVTVPLGNEIVIKGLVGSGDSWIPLPYNWQLAEQEIEFVLTYTASEELIESGATLTILIGGYPVKTTSIIGDGQSHTTIFSFPVNMVYQGSGIYVQYEAYLPTTNEACEETLLPSQWLIISGDSSISLIPDENPVAPNLSNLYDSLVANTPFALGHDLIVVLPDSPSVDYLETLVNFSQWFGARYTRHPRPFTMRFESSLTALERAQSNLVMIGEPNVNKLIPEVLLNIPYEVYNNDKLLTLDGEIVPDQDAVFHIAKSPWNSTNNVLLITGNSSAAIRNGGSALNQPSIMSKLGGQSVFINSDAVNDAELFLLSDASMRVESDFITFEDADTGTVFGRGVGKSTQQIGLTRRPGWVLLEGSEVFLEIGTSFLDRGSNVAVFFDGLFLGVVDTAERGQVEMSFPIPVEDINKIWDANPSTTILLTLEITNAFQVTPCQTSLEETVWTRIEKTSFLKLPHTYTQLPDISAFPYPFTESLLDTTFILPDQPTEADITIMMQLAAEIGEFANSDVRLFVSTASEGIIADMQNAIIIGEVERQPLIEVILQDMPDLPFRDVYTNFFSNTGIGVIREVIAPWDISSTVLLVYGNNAQALNAAVETLNARRVPDGAFVREEDGVRVIELAQ